MSWLNDLYETYESCKSEAGIIKDNQPILLPIAHSTQNAQVEIVIDENSHFLRADLVDKKDAVTVIPVTEDSSSRSGSAVFPHPLADKLEYLAGDYVTYVSGYKLDKFPVYLNQLEQWADSEYAVQQIQCVRNYLKEKHVMSDLMQVGLFTCENGVICGEKQQGIAPGDWLVRFAVEIPKHPESRLYCDREVFESYIQFYLSQQSTLDLCYVSGEIVPCSEKHPSKIRNTADKAKLISSNNASGFFTYKGRFSNSSQAAMISYEISQKAHNALRWLIARQTCLRMGEQVIVVWSRENPELDDIFGEHLAEESSDETAFTDEKYAEQVKKSIWGTADVPNKGEKVTVMGVEAATTGRLSITLYQQYEAPFFLERIADWKSKVSWMRKLGKDQPYKRWSPSLLAIIRLMIGDINKKGNKYMRERLVACIVEGRKIPQDMMTLAIQKAVNPAYFENYYEWMEGIDITCALLRKYLIERKDKEAMNMDSKKECRSRSYIFGQLLATAEMLERKAVLMGTGKPIERNTTVEKYFVRFQKYPVQTWGIIRNLLQPYVMKLVVADKEFYVNQMDNFTAELDMADKTKLEPTFLQGYSTQLMEYRNYQEKKKQNDKEEE